MSQSTAPAEPIIGRRIRIPVMGVAVLIAFLFAAGYPRVGVLAISAIGLAVVVALTVQGRRVAAGWLTGALGVLWAVTALAIGEGGAVLPLVGSAGLLAVAVFAPGWVRRRVLGRRG